MDGFGFVFGKRKNKKSNQLFLVVSYPQTVFYCEKITMGIALAIGLAELTVGRALSQKFLL